MMRYLLLSVLVVCMIGILMVPNAFAIKTVTVQNAPGSSVSGCQPNCFIPNTVRINPGDTVVWTNPDTMYHVVRSFDKDGVFDSSIMLPGTTFSYTYVNSGTYNYFCSAHPWMEGTVLVSGGTSSPSSTSKTPTNLILDLLPPSFKVKGSDSRVDVTVSGKLFDDNNFSITNAPITLKLTGFTIESGKTIKEIKTDGDGKFEWTASMPVGKGYGIQAVFDGGTYQSGEIVAPSKSQTEFFTVIASSPSSLGGPTFLKLDIRTDKRDVTISGQLTDKATKSFVVRDAEIILTSSDFDFTKNVNGCKVSELPNCVLKTDRFGKFAVGFSIGTGVFEIQAIFDGNNQWKSSKSQTTSFTVTSSGSSSTTTPPDKSPPPVSTSGSSEWTPILIILGVVCAAGGFGGYAILASKNKKKTPKTQPKTFGVKPPKKGRTTRPPVGKPSSADGPSTYGYFECPNCHEPSPPQGKLGQNPDGSQFCPECGWRS